MPRPFAFLAISRWEIDRLCVDSVIYVQMSGQKIAMVKDFATAKKGNSSNVGKAAVLESVKFQMSAAFL